MPLKRTILFTFILSGAPVTTRVAKLARLELVMEQVQSLPLLVIFFVYSNRESDTVSALNLAIPCPKAWVQLRISNNKISKKGGSLLSLTLRGLALYGGRSIILSIGNIRNGNC